MGGRVSSLLEVVHAVVGRNTYRRPEEYLRKSHTLKARREHSTRMSAKPRQQPLRLAAVAFFGALRFPIGARIEASTTPQTFELR
jgi:hypothetical protein